MKQKSRSKNGAESETSTGKSESYQIQSSKSFRGKELNVVLQNITHAVIRYDCELHILWANRAGYKFLEKHRDPFEVPDCQAFWSNTVGLYPSRPVTKTIETGKSYNAVITLSKGNIWRLESYPVFDENNQLEGAIEIASPSEKTDNICEKKVNNFWESLSLLTDREIQVMNLVAEGEINRAIANQLQLSPKTVEIHRARMMKKLKVDSVAHLVRYLVKVGLI
jgi:DNA-binding CsgD family transcriptional regulator